MSYRNLKPVEAKKLLDANEAWSYVDVRSVEEFQGGHPPLAFNVPLATRGAAGMAPNPEFAAVMQRSFAKDAKLVVGCASGGRSARACEMLAAAGFTSLANMECGFLGARDESGRSMPGWQPLGLPVESVAPKERTYEALRARK